MDRTADLAAALSFVIRRIDEQAMLSGEPLSEEQRMLLNYLPSTPEVFDPETQLVPRNVNYERVCALGKAAYLNDRQINPASLDWDFAFAVFTLNCHPMWGLLKWAGVKHRRPWWDYFLLMTAALLVAVGTVAVALFLMYEPWTTFQRVVFGSGYLGIMFSMYLASRRREKRQLEKDVERCRLASRFVGTIAS